MNINATLINLYHVCKREMWLHANGIRMEQTSDTVAEGKLIGETTYPQRAEKYTELEIGGSKIDFYDAKNRVIHEVKKSDSMEEAHEWQVKYYIWLLEQNGIEGVKGVLEYPKLRQTKNIEFTDEDQNYLRKTVQQIEAIIGGESCPPVIKARLCKQCSYYDFCYITET
ncbi:CRISPR-associated protein Cas4 [Niastella koreensis]|uniref:CRISPR-associated exonuclease Cas4 n=2 Tax=Niastella koreensis TaxID=354356 RepID=G8TQ73_NIAKG|nr:CRISPR-associated protein Cas4 [Niastella koreensis]AEW01074.1 CRISPR-associated exonuclease, Cas4 family [Niastella koreensis GR20-10]OQP41795.1 CRISPR-associated protein Cas4 [Niastella koreensis]